MDQNGLQSATFLSITMDMEDYKSSCSTRFDFLLPIWVQSERMDFDSL